jgi:hypothetical protein
MGTRTGRSAAAAAYVISCLIVAAVVPSAAFGQQGQAVESLLLSRLMISCG